MRFYGEPQAGGSGMMAGLPWQYGKNPYFDVDGGLGAG